MEMRWAQFGEIKLILSRVKILFKFYHSHFAVAIAAQLAHHFFSKFSVFPFLQAAFPWNWYALPKFDYSFVLLSKVSLKNLLIQNKCRFIYLNSKNTHIFARWLDQQMNKHQSNDIATKRQKFMNPNFPNPTFAGKVFQFQFEFMMRLCGFSACA